MRHAAQEALCNPEFCSTLGRRKAPFCLFSSRKQEADKVWLVWDGVLPQVSLQPSQEAPTGHHWTSRWLQKDSGPLFRQLSVMSLIQDCVLSLNHSALSASISLLSSLGREGTFQRVPFPICPLQGAASPGISSGRSQCLLLTWTDPGAGTPPNRQEDEWALGAQMRPGGKRGEESWGQSL